MFLAEWPLHLFCFVVKCFICPYLCVEVQFLYVISCLMELFLFIGIYFNSVSIACSDMPC